jgi:hypothetical protein
MIEKDAADTNCRIGLSSIAGFDCIGTVDIGCCIVGADDTAGADGTADLDFDTLVDLERKFVRRAEALKCR